MGTTRVFKEVVAQVEYRGIPHGLLVQEQGQALTVPHPDHQDDRAHGLGVATSIRAEELEYSAGRCDVAAYPQTRYHMHEPVVVLWHAPALGGEVDIKCANGNERYDGHIVWVGGWD